MPSRGERVLSRRIIAAAAVACALSAGGCGGGSSTGGTTGSTTGSTGSSTSSATSAATPPAQQGASPTVVTPSTPVPCAGSTGLALPADWPARVPLPAKLVITRVERRSGQRLIVGGRVPGDFHAVVRYLGKALPAAGYPQHGGELDPRDAESDFSGSDLRGRWTVGHSPDCPKQTELTMLVGPAS